MPIFVGDVEITDDAVFNEMQYHPAPSMEAARNAAAQALVVRELLRQEARRQKRKIGDEDARLMGLIEEAVSVPAATTEICRHYYEQNEARFRASNLPDQVVPFEAVEDKIRDYLQTRSMREGIRSYVLSLAEQTRIAGFDIAAAL
ncbi:hypothetical protein [Pseudokordiimonas caeni]|uniref:hypothetical protein n=1 Tax=Pseudokordiimonas caeni TaxID=2997908 RepID=UPI0028118C85|nr:hypothetical protein [Pseudokordiimonas caeni]